MRNHTQIGLEYIPWDQNGENTSGLIEPHPYKFNEHFPHAVSAYAYSAAIIAVYAIVIILLIVVQLRSKRTDPADYYDEGYNDEKELLEEELEDEGRSLLRIDVERMSGLKDAHQLDKMPSQRV